jgi:predicted lipid-binding transport protein (Tim44 family)
MRRSWRPLELKCLTAAVAVALLAAPTVQTATANSRPATRGGLATAAQHVEPKQAQPNGSGKSYFWTDAAIVGGVLAGILALGLWGDVAIGGVILGIELLCAGTAIAARKVGAQAREGSRRMRQVARSKPAASSR